MFWATEIFAGLMVNFLIVCRKNHLECFVSAIPNIEYSKGMHTDFLDSIVASSGQHMTIPSKMLGM